MPIKDYWLTVTARINPFAGLPRPAILQVIPALETGGAERTTIDIARAIVAAGGRAIVASRGGRMVDELRGVGGEHVEMAVHSKNPVVMALNVERLVRLIEREKVDLVHARSRAPGWSALAAARRARKPFVTTYHSKVHEAPRLKVFYNSVMARGDAVIANSNFTAERIRRVHAPDPARVFTVPRGVDVERFDPHAVAPERLAALWTQWRVGPLERGDERRAVFLLPARLTRWKGQLAAIMAAARLHAGGRRDFLLLLAGDAQGRDGYTDELHAAVVQSGLEDAVRIVGHCDDMPAAYALADIVLSPAIEPEPFGRVAVEAQAMRRPVIVSDAGGGCETVRTPEEAGMEHATGLRVPPGDAQALAAAMARLLDLGAGGRAAMGAQGRLNALTHYSVGAMCHATLEVYAELVRRARS